MRVFRRSISALASILLVAVATKQSSATVLLSDGFTNDTVGNEPTSPFNQSYETAAGQTGGTVRVRADTGNLFGAGTSNHVLSINNLTSNGGAYTEAKTIAGATDIETLSFNYYEPTESGTGTPLFLQIGNGDTSGGSSTATVISLQLNDGKIGSAAAYSLDTFHLIQVVVNNTSAAVPSGDGTTNVNAQEANTYIDGKLVVSNYGKDGTPTALVNMALNSVSFQVYGGANQNQQSYIDNVQLVDSASVPEPAGLSVMLVAGAGLMRRRRNA